MSTIRRKTAEHLSHAWTTIPHVTNCDEADVRRLEEIRRDLKARAEERGVKLTITAMILRVVGVGLRAFPGFNASVDMKQREIVVKESVHVGVAVDTPRGLLVPVVRDADRKGMLEIAADLTDLSERARAGELSIDEMRGGGFTVSNLGGLGTTHFTPIINWPEVAILGVGRAVDRLVPGPDGPEARRMLPLSLSYDHRVIDGADAARFLRWIAATLERPMGLLLEG
jgi:pyruvate dehydrogenase E2 component (dihydrolipoamide acetyltransferase)